MATSKVPGTDEALTEETTVAAPRKGKFARMTTDEDVEKVQETINFLKPAARFAGHVALSALSPTYAARKITQEVVIGTARIIDSRREKKRAQEPQTTQ